METQLCIYNREKDKHIITAKHIFFQHQRSANFPLPTHIGKIQLSHMFIQHTDSLVTPSRAVAVSYSFNWYTRGTRDGLKHQTIIFGTQDKKMKCLYVEEYDNTPILA